MHVVNIVTFDCAVAGATRARAARRSYIVCALCGALCARGVALTTGLVQLVGFEGLTAGVAPRYAPVRAADVPSRASDGVGRPQDPSASAGARAVQVQRRVRLVVVVRFTVPDEQTATVTLLFDEQCVRAGAASRARSLSRGSWRAVARC